MKTLITDLKKGTLVFNKQSKNVNIVINDYNFTQKKVLLNIDYDTAPSYLTVIPKVKIMDYLQTESEGLSETTVIAFKLGLITENQLNTLFSVSDMFSGSYIPTKAIIKADEVIQKYNLLG